MSGLVAVSGGAPVPCREKWPQWLIARILLREARELVETR